MAHLFPLKSTIEKKFKRPNRLYSQWYLGIIFLGMEWSIWTLKIVWSSRCHSICFRSLEHAWLACLWEAVKASGESLNLPFLLSPVTLSFMSETFIFKLRISKYPSCLFLAAGQIAVFLPVCLHKGKVYQPEIWIIYGSIPREIIFSLRSGPPWILNDPSSLS